MIPRVEPKKGFCPSSTPERSHPARKTALRTHPYVGAAVPAARRSPPRHVGGGASTPRRPQSGRTAPEGAVTPADAANTASPPCRGRRLDAPASAKRTHSARRRCNPADAANTASPPVGGGASTPRRPLSGRTAPRGRCNPADIAIPGVWEPRLMPFPGNGGAQAERSPPTRRPNGTGREKSKISKKILWNCIF